MHVDGQDSPTSHNQAAHPDRKENRETSNPENLQGFLASASATAVEDLKKCQRASTSRYIPPKRFIWIARSEKNHIDRVSDTEGGQLARSIMARPSTYELEKSLDSGRIDEMFVYFLVGAVARLSHRN